MTGARVRQKGTLLSKGKIQLEDAGREKENLIQESIEIR
jgi:hypothetical protein